jgi:3-hydroxyisobutyrate dehydrogenase-like beta-hydroxyacid dehydrogenase
MSATRTVGLIGLGLMGTALAERLLAAGFRVIGWDIDPARGEALGQLGGESVAGAGKVLEACNRLLISLPTLEVVADVLRAAHAQLHDGHLLVDTSTGDPRQAVELGRQLASHGAVYLDATISGSSAQVRTSAVVVMVGGPSEAVARCGDLFSAFAREVIHTGPCGTGAQMKLVTNLVLGLNRAALAEGLAFARTLGLDAARTLEILRAGIAYSRIMDTKGEKMVGGDFTPQAKLSQHLKDVRLILDAGDGAGAKLPLSETHRALLELAESRGFGNADNSAIIRAYDK